MSTSPPLEIRGKDPTTNARAQFLYVADLFKGTLKVYPFAVLEVHTDSHRYFGEIQQGLVNAGIPPVKIVPLIITDAFTPSPIWMTPGTPSSFQILAKQDWARICINYREGSPQKQRFSVAFKPEKDPPVEIEFEVAPDGTMLTEVKAEWATPLKKIISDSARMNVRQLKLATKIVGLAGFERKTVENIETELKGKLKGTLSMFLGNANMGFMKITFYGEVGMKYADDKVKPFGGGGFLFEAPFDITDIIK